MASVGRGGQSVELTSHYLIQSFHGLRVQSRYPPGILLWRDGWIETSFQLPCTISRRYGSRPFLFHLSEKDCCLKSWIRRDCSGQGSARCVRTSPTDIIILYLCYVADNHVCLAYTTRQRWPKRELAILSCYSHTLVL
jgi:hypothetical protein